ncbi:hypothetical protein ACFU96_40030 [Streptomyces sp. NPDC057620]|uniref:hypothetical protein n=1 Tax=Streptomyces sp. NPDC057620 TaxID=3346185 RepID=UPI0036A7674E
MDPGTAAVLGAATGVVGTLGAAILGYAATKHQLPEQARLEHAKTLREERREAYLQLLSIAEPVQRAAHLLIPVAQGEDLVYDWRALEEVAAEVKDATPRVYDLYLVVALAGPNEISQLAFQIFSQVVVLRNFLRKICEAQSIVDEQEKLNVVSAVLQARSTFATKAQELLGKHTQ